MPLAKWVNEVKWTTSYYIEVGRCLRYSRGVQQQRPGLVKAAPVPAELMEDERNGAIVRSVLDALDALISTEMGPVPGVFEWGTPERGGARLMRSCDAQEAESLRITWNNNRIKRIEIESRTDTRFPEPAWPVEPSAFLERLIPMVWAYIQRGGELPSGIDRFARLF